VINHDSQSPRRRSSRAVPALIAILFAAATVMAGGRVVAVGDVHGTVDGLTGILRAADLIDESNVWIGGDATLVQTGDLLDRGIQLREVMDLLMRLQTEAPESGGNVIVLLGNHETMNLLGIRRDVNRDAYAAFADDQSEARRTEAFETFKRYWQRRYRERGRDVKLTRDAREQWFAMYPLGYFEYGDALSPKGKYGAWLRSLPVATVVDGTLFIHGGYGPMLEGLTVEEINGRVKSELRTFDDYHDYMVDSGLTLPWFSAPEMAGEVATEIQILEASAGDGDAFDDRRFARLERARGFLHWSNWLIVHAEGPLWYRGAAKWDESERGEEMAALLDGLGVKQMVVGHTVRRSNRIESRFGGRVYLIDTGMLESVYAGRASALEISGDTVTAIYTDGRQILVDGSDRRSRRD
jgi:hypothetical protein